MEVEDKTNETEILRTELEHYKSERERIRRIIGQIGGNHEKGRDLAINALFLAVVLCLFAFDFLREVFGIMIHNLPPALSMELALLLVSLKIIWMIHKQTKVDHFQFWMLNSIEFQINTVSQRLQSLEDQLNKRDTESSG